MTTVIMVPGLMGSTLQLNQGTKAQVDVWYNPKRTSLKGPEDFGLASDGISPASYASGPLEPADDICLPLYAPAFRTIAEAGLDPVFFGYDWRLSILHNGVLLSNYIIEKLQGTAFYVIGYSLGGLIARVAYNKLTGDPSQANWLRTLFVGVPHGGSLDALSTITAGVSTFPMLYYFALNTGANLNRLASMQWKQTSTADRFNKVLATWPSLYELFPSRQATWLNIQPDIGRAWQLANLTKWNPYVTQARLDSAEATQAELERLLSQPQAAYDQVVSLGQDTSQGVKDFSKLALEEGYAYGLVGDGVVPAARATIAGDNVLRIDGKHGNLLAGFQVTQQLKKMLTVGQAPSAALPDPVPLKPPVQVAPPAYFPDFPIRPFPAIQITGDP